MTRTIISISGDDKKWIDGFGKRRRISSAEVIRRAIREFRLGRRETAGAIRAEWEHDASADSGTRSVKEGRAGYGSPGPSVITDVREMRQRAIDAAGRFDSGVPDLSVDHDRYLAEDPEADNPEEKGSATGSSGFARKTSDSAKKDGGAR